MKRHKFDTLSFISGLVIAGLGTLFLFPSEPGGIFDFVGEAGTWLLPALFLTVGVVVLVPPLLRSRDQDDETKKSEI
jgi:hypothetical protein